MREVTEKAFYCQHCEGEFIATRTASYCSPRCRTAASRLRSKPSLLADLVANRPDMIEKWNVVRSASDYAEKMILEIYRTGSLDLAILAISAGYGVQMNIDTKTEEQYQRQELIKADMIARATVR